MLLLITLLALVGNFNYALTDEFSEAVSYASATGSGSASAASVATASAIATGNDNNCNPNVKCGKNQVYDPCPSGCPPRTCATKDIAFSCLVPLKPGDPNCPKPICRCSNNFYSNDKGECVPKEKCPTKPKCGKNQVYDLCPSSCPPRTCDTKDIAIKCKEPLKPGDPNCPRPTCRCDNGYYKNDQGECVTKEECPTKTCGENEEYIYCPAPTCANQTCENIGKKFGCPALPDKYPCKGECRCKTGYYRNKIGQCISEEDCKKCPGKYEYFSCGGACDNECKNLSQQNQTNCPIINVKCNPMCYCLKNYARDPVTNECIPISKCPPECKQNEIYSNCPNNECRPKTCDELGRPLPCYQSEKNNTGCGKPGCICEPDYVKNKHGKCIPLKECPSCGGDPNAWAGCGVNCVTCDNYKEENQICLLYCNLNGCDCRPGHVYDKIKKKCVEPKDCPPKCGLNEVPSNCGNNPCLPTCDEPEKNTYCDPNPANCKPGCVCADGYVRNQDNVCVPKNKCPPKVICGANEEYVPCPKPTCANETCENVGKIFECPFIPSNYKCKGECRCIKGYYKNKLGDCISEENCKKCQGGNEYFSCGGACDNECKNLSQQNQTNCPIINIVCNQMCYCDEGFARDPVTNKCIPISQCPPECKKNETFSICPNNECRAKTCDDLGLPLPCYQSENKNTECGKPGCVCEQGYVKNKDGECIAERDCPSCGGDPNAWSGCGVFCDTCANYQDNHACPLYCKLNSCDCRPGYVYNGSTGKCVLPGECPPKCGRNEVPSDCANSPCIRNCATKDLNLQCRPYPPGCKPGCVCADGYLRDDNKVCVPINKCPNKCKCNEEYNQCPGKECRPKTCDELGFPLACDQYPRNNTSCGKPGCICKPGYVKNKNGVCIDPKKCPSCGGDPNAQPGCGTFCTNCDNYKDKGRACPDSCLLNGCECRPEYVFDSKVSKKCVLPKECPCN